MSKTGSVIRCASGTGFWWTDELTEWRRKNIKHRCSINLMEKSIWFENDEEAVLFCARWEGDRYSRP